MASRKDIAGKRTAFLGAEVQCRRRRDDANLGKQEGHHQEEDAPAFLGPEVGRRREQEARPSGEQEVRPSGEQEARLYGEQEAR